MSLKIRRTLFDLKTASYGKDSGKESSAPGINLTDCSLGTNPFGHSPVVAEAISLTQKIDLSLYPTSYDDLKEAIMRRWESITPLQRGQIVFGGGAIDIIAKTNRIFIDPGSLVLGAAPQFPDYANDVRCMGGVYQAVPFDQSAGYAFNVERFLQAMDQRHTIVHLDNPNNPTGQCLPLESIRTITEKAASMNICVVIDEAYGDFMDDGESAIGLVNNYENLLVIRSFSKGLGLAGLRIGYMIASETICRYYEQAGAPFTINSLGHQLGKLVLADEAFIRDAKEKITRLKTAVREACRHVAVLKTDDRVPIMVLEHPDEDCNLYRLFLENGIVTVTGACFESLGKRHGRLRVPRDIDRLRTSIQEIEAGLS